MKALIDIDMNNAAFNPGESGGWTHEGLDEVARILRDLAGRLEADNVSEHLRDSNGNRVGTFLLTMEED